jgi:hypothetical protein
MTLDDGDVPRAVVVFVSLLEGLPPMGALLAE